MGDTLLSLCVTQSLFQTHTRLRPHVHVCQVFYVTRKFKEESLQDVVAGFLVAGQKSFCELNIYPPFRNIFIDCT